MNRRGRGASNYNGRFGPYNEYEVFRAKDTMERLVASSRNMNVQRLLNKAYQCNIKWGGYDRFEYHSKPLFPSASEWSSQQAAATQTSASESVESRTKSQLRGSNSEEFFVIDKKGNNPEDGQETNSLDELPKGSHDLYQTNVNRWNSLEEEETEGVADEVIVIGDEEEEDCHEHTNEEVALGLVSSHNTVSEIHTSEGSEEVEEGELSERQDETDGSVMRGIDMVTRLKCDICNFNVEASEMVPMTVHLNSAKHYGASLFKGYMYGNEFCPSCTVEREVVKTKENEIATLIPICPLCSEVFPSIWTCAVHSYRQHNQRVYGLGKVLYSKVVLVSKEPKCDECGRLFDSHKSLHQHWKATMLHYPYQLPTLDQVVVFSCLYCHTYFSYFVPARMHSCRRHNDRQSESLGLRVIYVEKSTEQITLPSLTQTQGTEQWFKRNAYQAEMIQISRKQLRNRFMSPEMWNKRKQTIKINRKKKIKEKRKGKGEPVISVISQS